MLDLISSPLFSGYEKETAKDVFSNILNIFSQVGTNLKSLDWTGLSTFQPVSGIAKVIQLSNDEDYQLHANCESRIKKQYCSFH